MKRNVKGLSGAPFDIVIVGAGIHGAAAAWAAARRGLSVALIDKGDFGAATSANSMKVIHGGLRYLQHLNLGRMRESIAARSRFLRMAPHLVYPRSFMMPTFGHALHSREVMRMALAMNDLISCDRNAGIAPERRLPRGRILSRGECMAMLPGLDRPDFTGGAIWHDGFAESTERVNLAFVATACEAGAVAANHVRADRLIVENGRAAGCKATDLMTGNAVAIRSKTVLNAAGPWMNRIDGAASTPRGWVKAYNLVIDKPWFSDTGLAIESASDFHDPDAVVQRGKRNLFFVPWRRGAMAGTLYRFYDELPDRLALTDDEVLEFVREVNLLYPALAVKPADVTLAQIGVLPARPGLTDSSPAQPDKHSEVIDHETGGGIKGLLSIKGVKYTTGLNVGEDAARIAAAKAGMTAWAKMPDALIGGDRIVRASEVVAAAKARGLNLSETDGARLAMLYGTRFDRIIDAAPAAGSVAPPAGAPPTLAAEVLYGIREEAACRLSDVVVRRTDLGTFAHPGRPVLDFCADLMARELGWDARQREAEIAETTRIYYTPRP